MKSVAKNLIFCQINIIGETLHMYVAIFGELFASQRLQILFKQQQVADDTQKVLYV